MDLTKVTLSSCLNPLPLYASSFDSSQTTEITSNKDFVRNFFLALSMNRKAAAEKSRGSRRTNAPTPKKRPRRSR
ncbi:hypothetical protein P9112_003878 [Eukaryota sp. TZLM1-RC]